MLEFFHFDGLSEGANLKKIVVMTMEKDFMKNAVQN